MEPIVASGADGVEPLGGGPAKASTPSPAYSVGFLMNYQPGHSLVSILTTF